MNFEALINTLNEELSVYKEIIEVEKEKTDILIEGNIVKLDAILHTEEMLSMKLNNAEKRRLGIMDGLGIPNKTLREVIGLVPKNDTSKARARMIRLFNGLTEQTNKFKEISSHNAKLIKARLSVTTELAEYLVTGKTSPKEKKGEKTVSYGKNAKVISQSSDNNTMAIKKKI